MKFKELVTEIVDIANGIYDHEVFFPLKKYGVRRIYDIHKELMKYIIVIDGLGFPITTHMVCECRGEYTLSRRNATGSILSKLGDKNVLDLMGYGQRGMLLYQVHKEFQKLIKIDYTKINKLRTRLETEGITG